MKLFWRDRQGEKQEESLLLTEPAAKLASIEFRDGVYYFKCLGFYEKLAVGTLPEAKRLAETKLRHVLTNILNALMDGDLPDVQANVAPDARATRNG